jgi:hypothetical protein
MAYSFIAAARRGNFGQRRCRGALFIMLVAEHRTQAQNAPRVAWMLPGPSTLNPSAGSEANLRDLRYVEGGNIGNNFTGLIRFRRRVRRQQV